MYFYLSIPKGMKYQQINKVDYFVAQDDNNICLNIQDLVKEKLRHWTSKVEQSAEITIYRKIPFNSNELFLKYLPCNNGKYATTEPPIEVDRHSCNSEPLTKYGTFWYETKPLSEDKLKEVMIKKEAQQANRRHYGDSPLAT